MRNFVIGTIVVIYVIYLIYTNSEIANQQGSSLGEQIMLLFAAVGIYFIVKKFIK